MAKFGFINKGEFVIEPQFDYADNFRDNMLATIKQMVNSGLLI